MMDPGSELGRSIPTSFPLGQLALHDSFICAPSDGTKPFQSKITDHLRLQVRKILSFFALRETYLLKKYKPPKLHLYCLRLSFLNLTFLNNTKCLRISSRSMSMVSFVTPNTEQCIITRYNLYIMYESEDTYQCASLGL